MYEGLADWTIKLLEKKQCEYAEARLEQGSGDAYVLNNGQVEASEFNEASGLGIRFLINKHMGFVSLNKFDKKIIEATINRAIKIVRATNKLQCNMGLAQDRTNRASYAAHQKIKLEDVRPEEKINALLEVDKYILQSSPKTDRLLSLDTETVTKYFVNSEGTRITCTIPRTSFDYNLTVRDGSKTAGQNWMYGSTKGWESWREWDLKNKLASEVKALLNNIKYGVKPPAGKVSVVVAPPVTGIMVHESIGHPHEADRIFGREAAQAGESYIKSASQLGTRLGSDAVTIYEDPTLAGTYGYYLYDDEGVKARRRVLIKKGIINEFLHNRETASDMCTKYQLCNIKSNASARAEGFGYEPIVRMSNSFVAPGEYKDDELIADTKLGIYMKSFTEWNINDTRENQKYVGSECYLIKNGKIISPVRKPVIEITTPHLWSSIDAVGRRIELHSAPCGKGEPMQTIPVTHGGPHMRIRNIIVK